MSVVTAEETPVGSGLIVVKVRADETSLPNTSTLTPGVFTDAVTWLATDISAQPQEVKDACSTAWTQPVVDAYKASHPFVAPPALTLDQQRTAAVRLNARRQALINAIQNNDDVGLIAAAQARYPSLTGDAAKFAADVILLIAGSIRT